MPEGPFPGQAPLDWPSEREIRLNPAPSASASGNGMVFLPRPLYQRLLALAQERGTTVLGIIQGAVESQEDDEA